VAMMVVSKTLESIPHEFLIEIEAKAQEIKSNCSVQGATGKKYFDELRVAFYNIFKRCLSSCAEESTSNEEKKIEQVNQRAHELTKIFINHFNSYNFGGMIRDYTGDFQKMQTEFQQGLNGIRNRIQIGLAKKMRRKKHAHWITSISCFASVGAFLIMLIDKFSK
jgi:hypothetical protein